MAQNAPKHRRNLFEIDNARNLSKEELVDTFIPTQSFWRLLSAKHNVLLGARGQGKTAIAKMLSHDHLAALAATDCEPRATSAVRNQEFIGTYLPTRLEWVGGLKNKSWLDEREREELFQWRLNIASCIALIPVAQSCIATYVCGRVNQAKAERELTQLLSKDWIIEESGSFQDLLQLRKFLEDTDYAKQIQLLRQRALGRLPSNELPVGLAFGLELFTPFRQGIRQLSRVLSINPDCTWLICLDEAEFLAPMDHRIINSHMRAYPDNLFIKMATMPYCHYTLSTNIGAALVPGQDFGYINMDSDRVLNARAQGEADTIGTLFGRTLFGKLIEASDPEVFVGRDRELPGITDILGESEILSPQREIWSKDSKNMKLLEKYGSADTVARAHKLLGTPEFAPAIGRKINGALVLRAEVENAKGNSALTVYSGARMAIRCADDNPRHMIKIFNSLLMQLTKSQKRKIRVRGSRVRAISKENQTRAMRSLSTTTLNQYRSFPDVGPELHAFLTMIGQFMQDDFHKAALTTDQITSVKIDATVSVQEWHLVCVAVGHGLLHPNVNANNPDEMPVRDGTFHLAYALAPHFLLLPRRGKSVKLSSVRAYHQMSDQARASTWKADSKQLQLFDYEGEE